MAAPSGPRAQWVHDARPGYPARLAPHSPESLLYCRRRQLSLQLRGPRRYALIAHLELIISTCGQASEAAPGGRASILAVRKRGSRSRRYFRARPSWGWATTAVLGIVFVGSTVWALWYPKVQTHDGWVVVVAEDGDVPQGTQVRLGVTNDAENGLASYTVSACGGGDAELLLLIGGSARLMDPSTGLLDQRIADVEASRVETEGMGSAPLSGIQQVAIELVDMHPCLADGWFGVVGASIEGEPRRQFSNRNEFIPWVRETYTFPLVGQFPGLDLSLGGVFRLGHVSGDFYRPVPLTIEVQAGGVPLDRTVESSRPLLADSASLSWSQNTPFQPRAVVRRESFAAPATGLSAITGVLFGVAIGWRLPKRTEDEKQLVPDLPSRTPVVPRSYDDRGISRGWWAFAGAAWILSKLWSRVRQD